MAKPLTSLDIVLSIYNQEDLIEKVLGSIIRETTTPFNLILIFDGCTDNTEKKALEFIHSTAHPLMKELRTAITPNVYETRANNAGFRLATTDIILTLQDDMVIEEKGWEKRLSYPIRAFDDIFAVSSRTAMNVFFGKDSHLPIYNHIASRETWSLPRNRFAIRNIINRGPVALNAIALRKLGYLDENFAPAQFDEADIAMTAYEKLGLKSGSLWINYRSDESWGKTRTASTSMNTRRTFEKNAKLLLSKHPQLASSSSAIIENRKISDRDIDFATRDSMPLWLKKRFSIGFKLSIWSASRKLNGLRVRIKNIYRKFRPA